MFSSLSLKYRIAIIIFCLEAVMMATVLQQTLNQSFEASTKQINTNEKAILDLVNGMSKAALVTEEYSELQPYVINLVTNTEITKLLLTDANKIIVVSSALTDIGNRQPELKERRDHNWQTVDITNASGLMGVLSIQFSNKSLSAAYTDARDFGISIALVGMLVIAIVGILVGFLLTRRLESITSIAKRLAEGDYSARTNVPGKDEIGELASTFNKMVQTLLESRDDLSNALIKLQEQEQNLAITLDSIGDAVITTDEDGNVTRMNPVAEKLTDWSLKEANGESLNKVFPIIDASTREPIKSPIEKVLKKGEVIYLSNHTTLISRNGFEYQIADSAAPIRDDGKIIGMVLVFNDVTEQYDLRKAQRESEERFRQLAEAINEVFWLGSPNWNEILYISPAYEKVWGHKAEDLYQNPRLWVEAVFPDDRDRVIEDIPKDLNNIGEVVNFREYRIVKPDGDIVWIKARAYPIKDKHGQIIRIAGIAEDITERINMEETLRRTQKMDALGKLTGGVAHDYNNLLGIILGYSEMLQAQLREQPKLIKFVDEIHRAGERGAKLTKKLLTFSRHHSLENKAINLNALLQNSLLMLEKTMTVRISLVLDLSENLWMVSLDLSDLEDAILNMSINAMHAIKGNGTVIFKTSNEVVSEEDAQHLQIVAGEYVLLSITDSGCGMDKDTQEKMFDPFFSTKGELGTGLGLSQVYGLVERSKGKINVYSELDHGSRIALYFPRYNASPNNETLSVDGEETEIKGNETILVVDDESALCDLTSHILTQNGYRVLTAYSGKDALLILENESIDLLLSDVIMPEMDGYQLAAIVSEKYPDIKIQLASGFSDDRHINIADKSLHKNLLHKPYHSNALLRRVRELLGD